MGWTHPQCSLSRFHSPCLLASAPLLVVRSSLSPSISFTFVVSLSFSFSSFLSRFLPWHGGYSSLVYYLAALEGLICTFVGPLCELPNPLIPLTVPVPVPVTPSTGAPVQLLRAVFIIIRLLLVRFCPLLRAGCLFTGCQGRFVIPLFCVSPPLLFLLGVFHPPLRPVTRLRTNK